MPLHYRLKKLFSWEFAPAWAYYGPIVPRYLWEAFRCGSLTFFTASNPGIYNGGMFGESKYEILKQIPFRNLPLTAFFEEFISVEILENAMREMGLSYPVILKPDIGERGLGVSKIRNEQEAQSYLRTARYPLLLQEYIDLQEEYALMYHRMPNEVHGKVLSLVRKEFLAVEGDGRSRLVELFHQQERTRIHFDLLCNIYSNSLDQILELGEKKRLVEIGNHARGTMFVDENVHITPKLGLALDAVADEFPGFYFGRFDLKANSLEALAKGDFKVMELNGAGAEPAHIYDPRNSPFVAWKALSQHFKVMGAIARKNYRAGAQRISLQEMWRMYKLYRENMRV